MPVIQRVQCKYCEKIREVYNGKYVISNKSYVLMSFGGTATRCTCDAILRTLIEYKNAR